MTKLELENTLADLEEEFGTELGPDFDYDDCSCDDCTEEIIAKARRILAKYQSGVAA